MKEQSDSIEFTTTHAHDGLLDDRFLLAPDGEYQAVTQVLAGRHLSGRAPVVTDYEQGLARTFHVPHAVAVSSGSAALLAALHVLGATDGAEVLLPATAPLPTALPILNSRAIPVVVDVKPGTLELDPADLRSKLTAKSKAVISVPLWGYPTDCSDALEVLSDRAIPLIEDAAQAHGTITAGHLAGTQGLIGCFSTHDRKLLATGEGGFIVTCDAELADRIRRFTQSSRSDGHTLNMNYKLGGMAAAIGLQRLDRLAWQLDIRRANANSILGSMENDFLFELPYGTDSAPNYYCLVLCSPHSGPRITRQLAEHGVLTDAIRYKYRPIYEQPLFRAWASECPNAKELIANSHQIPVHPDLSRDALEYLVGCINDVARA